MLRKKAGSYHHHDLRRALLDATLQLIERSGPEGFTLRAAAKAAGVSDSAPYHHFADKEGLLAAVAEEGFTLLGKRLLQIAERGLRPLEAAAATAEEYVVFAASHPSHFRVMMSRKVLNNTEHQGLASAALTAFSIAREALLKSNEHISPEISRDALIFGGWALVHGFAFLAVEGHLGPLANDEAALRNLVRSSMVAMGSQSKG